MAAGLILAALSVGGCATATAQSGVPQPSAPARARPTARSASVQFPGAQLNAENAHCDASQQAARQAPIVHRPASLPSTAKVPLLLALHGSGGSPQAMEGLTHFVEVADKHGFVAVLPATCAQDHPWAPPEDLSYLGSLISQMESNPNAFGPNNPGPIDPSRVYVTGFSRGGFETYRLGCALSAKIAAIAVVSFGMNGVLYDTCTLTKPLSELLVVGSADSTRYTGIPGVQPSATQTTARWRSLDGCSASAITQQPIASVTQQVWGNCVDGSAVGLVTLNGAGHVWPPYGSGAPPNYPTSEAVWSFLSAHTSAPTSLTRSHVRLASVQAARARGGRAVRATFHIGEPLTIAGRLLFRAHPVSRSRVVMRAAGLTPVVMSFAVPRSAPAGRYSAVFDVVDTYGRQRTLHRSVTVPRAPGH